MKMRSVSRALDKIYKRRDRLDIPEWQREEVWTESKKQSLIDTILKGWKLPKFYFLKTNDDPETFDVVDGQQRLAAIIEFFEGELALSAAAAKEHGASVYRELPDPVQDQFDDYEIEFDQIEDATDEEVKEFFQRLQAGLPLTSSEKLNSLHSKFRDFCKEQTKHAFFGEKVSISDRRYAHFDTVAKAAAIEVDGLDVGLRFQDLHAVFQAQAAFSPKSNIAKRIIESLDYLNRAFPERSKRLRNRTIVQSAITLAGAIVSTGKAKGTEPQFAAFFEFFMDELGKQVQLGQAATDPDFIEFQKTVSANVRSGPRLRQEIMMRKLFLFDPSFMELFDPKQLLESGLAKGIGTFAASIADYVHLMNTRYAAIKGEDFFKMTTKTAKALRTLSVVVTDKTAYDTLIDDLYFLFWEGGGNRLPDPPPQSFRDINTLRTLERHDVDHGKTSKIKAKRKSQGSIFAKYSGLPAPDMLGPEQFARVQMKLYVEIRKDLKTLHAKL